MWIAVAFVVMWAVVAALVLQIDVAVFIRIVSVIRESMALFNALIGESQVRCFDTHCLDLVYSLF